MMLQERTRVEEPFTPDTRIGEGLGVLQLLVCSPILKYGCKLHAVGNSPVAAGLLKLCKHNCLLLLLQWSLTVRAWQPF